MIDTTAATPLRRIISGTTGERGGGGPPPLPPRAPHNNSDRGQDVEYGRGERRTVQLAVQFIHPFDATSNTTGAAAPLELKSVSDTMTAASRQNVSSVGMEKHCANPYRG